MKKTTLIVCLLISFLLGGNCQVQSQNITMKPYLFKSNNGTEVDAEIGEFLVPENRKNSTKKTIKLSFVRFKSTNPNPSYPIIYLAGGPGGSGISTAKGKRFELFMALREIADVIAFDQRGTGLSNPIPTCNKSAQFDLMTPGSAEAYITKMRETAKECLDFWQTEGIDITAYNTRESAHDLEDLRKALGAEKINLWGISYGTHLGFAFVKQYENRLHKMVMASLEGPDQSIKLPEYNQQFLTYLSQKILEDTEAKEIYPDLLGTMKKVFDQLDKEPALAKGVDPRSGQAFQVMISKFDLQLITSFFLLKNPSDSKKMPMLFKQMAAGDFSGVANYAAIVKLYLGRIQAMSFAMDAMSGISKKRWKQVQLQSENALLGRTTNFPFPDVTEGLDLPDLGKSFRKNPKSQVPSLFFSGTLDGRTYVPEAKELVKGFQHSVHVIIDGAGHDLFMSTPKVKEMMLDFFAGKSVESKTISIPMPNFIVDKQ